MQQFFGAVALLIAAALVFSGARPGADFGSVADWAQVAGSLAALGGIYWSTTRTITAQLGPLRNARRDFINAVSDAVDLALGDIDDVRAAARAADRNGVVAAWDLSDQERWKAFEAIIRIPIERWPSAIFYVRTSALYNAFHRYQSTVDSFVTNARQGFGVIDSVSHREGELAVALTGFKQSLAGLKID